jgi:hypothetical protein
MQPLVAITVNKNDDQVPAEGLNPLIEIEEQVNNYGVLGDANEPLLAEALSHISATNKVANAPKGKVSKTVFDSNDLLPHSKEMYIEQ